MRIVADREVRDFVAQRGGFVTVSTRSQLCCTGALTTLEAETAAPDDPSSYERFDDDGIVVFYHSGRRAHPDELVFKLKGSKNQRLEALWDGCVYAL